jgi:hypothetical protein
MHPYDTGEQPPVAVLTVQVTDPATGKQESLPGKLDTGAALTVLPTAKVATLGLTARGEVWVAGYDGRAARVPAYFVSLEVSGYTIPTLKVTAAPRTQMLLGRDVLNNFVATFDGKNLTFDLVDP